MKSLVPLILLLAVSGLVGCDESEPRPCDPNPCFHGGTCAASGRSYACTCAAGYEGVQCETNVDDCATAPCGNGGLCIDRVAGYQCACAAGFAGSTCETNVDDCSPNPCTHGGVCVDGVDAFTCQCPTGTWGAICDGVAAPLAITTATPLPIAVPTVAYSAAMTLTGGSGHVQWSLVAGGTNDAWLAIDPATGVLTGTPTAAELGAVSVTVRVVDAYWPDNHAEKTLSFSVVDVPAVTYAEGFEGACPAGWTLTGDWQCGVPTTVGPSAAYAGTQCLGTVMGANYHDLQTWAGTTATSPAVALPAVTQTLSFRAWVDTEGSTYDGFHVEVSSDGGSTYATLTTVTPTYPLTIAGKPAWGGHQSALGWQLFEGDLSAYSGQTVRIRFAFQSDSSGNFPGVYVDDVRIGR